MSRSRTMSLGGKGRFKGNRSSSGSLLRTAVGAGRRSVDQEDVSQARVTKTASLSFSLGNGQNLLPYRALFEVGVEDLAQKQTLFGEWLEKETKENKWSKRYCVLDLKRCVMLFYLSAKDRKPRFFVPLWDTVVEGVIKKNTQNCFKIEDTTGVRKTIVLRAPNFKVLGSMIEKIKSVKQYHLRSAGKRFSGLWDAHIGADVDRAKWPEMLKAIQAYCDIPRGFPPRVQAHLRYVLSVLNPSDEPGFNAFTHIHKRAYERFLRYFGDMKRAWGNLAEIMLWFPGAIVQTDAAACIRGTPHGTFFLHVDERTQLLTVTHSVDGEPVHTAIHQEPFCEVFYTHLDEPYADAVEKILLFRREDFVTPLVGLPPLHEAYAKGFKAEDEGERAEMMPYARIVEGLMRARALMNGEQFMAGAGNDCSSIAEMNSNVSVEDIVHSVYSGWLHKEGGKHKNWKRRWCVIDRDRQVLYYFETPKSTKNKGYILLWNCKADEKRHLRENVFIVKHDQLREYRLQGETKGEVKEWVRIINQVCEESKAKFRTLETKMWRDAGWAADQKVKWPEFLAAFKHHYNLSFDTKTEDEMRLMLHSFALKGAAPDEVGEYQWVLFNRLFGDPKGCYDRFSEVVKFYQGGMVSKTVAALLEGQPKGTYMMRLRRFNKEDGMMSFSYVKGNGQVESTNVYRDPVHNRFFTDLKSPQYLNLHEFVRANPNFETPFLKDPPYYQEPYKQFAAERGEGEAMFPEVETLMDSGGKKGRRRNKSFFGEDQLVHHVTQEEPKSPEVKEGKSPGLKEGKSPDFKERLRSMTSFESPSPKRNRHPSFLKKQRSLKQESPSRNSFSLSGSAGKTTELAASTPPEVVALTKEYASMDHAKLVDLAVYLKNKDKNMTKVMKKTRAELEAQKVRLKRARRRLEAYEAKYGGLASDVSFDEADLVGLSSAAKKMLEEDEQQNHEVKEGVSPPPISPGRSKKLPMPTKSPRGVVSVSPGRDKKLPMPTKSPRDVVSVSPGRGKKLPTPTTSPRDVTSPVSPGREKKLPTPTTSPRDAALGRRKQLPMPSSATSPITSPGRNKKLPIPANSSDEDDYDIEILPPAPDTPSPRKKAPLRRPEGDAPTPVVGRRKELPQPTRTPKEKNDADKKS